MSEARRPFWIGALAGAVIAAVAAPAAIYFWLAYASDRAETRVQFAALGQRLDKTNQALMEMQKAASLAGVTRQLEELNTRIKLANEALAELQKTSASIQRSSLEKIADRLDRLDGDMKANVEAVNGLQKSSPLASLSKQIGQLQANLTALDVALANLKKAAAEPAARFDALDASMKAMDGRLGEIKTALDGSRNALADLQKAAPAKVDTTQLASALDEIKKGVDSAAATREKLLAGLAALQDKPQAAQPPQTSGTDLVVIHMDQGRAANSAQASGAADVMAPLSFEFKRLGAKDDAAQTDAVAAKVKELVKDRGKCAVSVAGYADTVGSDEFNLALSKKRAHTVAERLRQALGDGVQVAETGWGDRRLQVWTPDNTPKAENRRVDIAVHCER